MAELVGTSAPNALGRPCHALVRGDDAEGRSICRSGCDPFREIRAGRLNSSIDLTIPGEGEATHRLSCDLHALPGGASALGRLSTRHSESSRAGTVDERRPFDAQPDVLKDLLALAAIATTLTPENLPEGLERALGILSAATGAESAELFLAEPTGHDMVLTAYRGPYRHAFVQRLRFAPGEGFPGLAMAERQPIFSDTLADDARYLRDDVKKKGYSTYLCVPLFGSQSVLGAISIAFRGHDVDVAEALRLLGWASMPLATALEAALLQAIRIVTPSSIAFQGNDGDLDLLLHDVLHRTRQLAEADSGTLVLLNSYTNSVIRQVVDGYESQPTCPGSCHKGTLASCPAISDGHGVSLTGPRQDWPIQCRHLRRRARASYCLPLQSDDKNIGLIQLNYTDKTPFPATRYLAILMEGATQAAAILNIGQIRHDANHNSAPEHSPNAIDAPKTLVRTGDAESRTGPTPVEPRLRIRCFGSFELYRDGVLIGPNRFKRRKALDLLKILLVQAGRPVQNETLIEHLWPESDPESGANRLHVIVHALRRVIEPGVANGEWEFVRSDRDHYLFAISESSSWLDLAEFPAAIAAGREAEERGDQSAAISAYDAAVRLYRGDLLEDEPLAEWCFLDREYLRELYLGTLQRVAELSVRSGNAERAISGYLQVLRNDPLRETAVRPLMECMWQSGRRAEALRQYDLFCQILRREIEVAPLPETQALAQRIRSQPSP